MIAIVKDKPASKQRIRHPPTQLFKDNVVALSRLESLGGAVHGLVSLHHQLGL